MTPSPPPAPGSLIRSVVGAVALVVSLVTIAAGFVNLVSTLQNEGDSTGAVLVAPIAVFALGGGLLALGIGLIIWEVSIRYGIRK